LRVEDIIAKRRIASFLRVAYKDFE
jgi:hypothetical protein